MGFPNLNLGEAIFLTRFEEGKAMGVQGLAKRFTVHQNMDYVDFGDPYNPYKIPTEFRVELDIEMLALRTVIMDVGTDIWTPDSTTPLPQPRLGEGKY